MIIPLYNAERYIGECLESVLNQTFKNFEVIVVDDCSTDNSRAVVQSYAEKFGGRLILSRMDKNSGSGSLPRNKGMGLARGEYLFFLDNDDMITPTALEEVYTLAKKFDADFLYCDNHYVSNSDGSGIRKRLGENFPTVDKPTFESEHLPDRVQQIIRYRYRAPQWLKFVRRRLIFEHELFFPNTRHADDHIWTAALTLLVKKFLLVPNSVYIYRLSEDSIMRAKKTPQQTINFWLNPSLVALKAFDKFLGKTTLEPQYRYALLENMLQSHFALMFQESLKLPPFAVYETIKQEFGQSFGEQDVLISALCAFINAQQKTFAVNQQKFNEFAAQAQRRIAELEQKN